MVNCSKVSFVDPTFIIIPPLILLPVVSTAVVEVCLFQYYYFDHYDVYSVLCFYFPNGSSCSGIQYCCFCLFEFLT